MMVMRKILLAMSLLFCTVMPVKSADRAQIAQFMAVTGFDVALESMRLSARDAPTMLGLDADDFGLSWSRLADRMFEPEALKSDALEILDKALTEDVLAHATGFYGSDLGQKLVSAENESHGLEFEDREVEGARLAQAADFVVAFLYMFTSSCKRPTSLSTLESVAWLMASGTGATTAADDRERRASTTPRAAARSAFQSIGTRKSSGTEATLRPGLPHVEPGPPIDRSVRWRTPSPHLQMPPECRRR